MMNNIIVRYCDLPHSVKGFVIKQCEECGDFYTIMINSRMSAEQQEETYQHEISHIKNMDFDAVSVSVDQIEMMRH